MSRHTRRYFSMEGRANVITLPCEELGDEHVEHEDCHSADEEICSMLLGDSTSDLHFPTTSLISVTIVASRPSA